MNYDSLMEELRKEYVSSLPDKIKSIQDCYKSGNILGVREAFHKLKGTGATYGIPEISTLGEILETYCIEYPEKLNDAVPDAITLLTQVHTSRLENTAFNIEADSRFQRIQSLLTK